MPVERKHQAYAPRESVRYRAVLVVLHVANSSFSQAAVVRGAAICGLEGLAPRLKQSRLHYGFDIGSPFRDGIDPEHQSYIDKFSNEKYCHNRMDWVVAKVS